MLDWALLETFGGIKTNPKCRIQSCNKDNLVSLHHSMFPYNLVKLSKRMTTPSNEQLKRALARMLPEKLLIFESYKPFLFYKDDREVKPTELLQLVWEIEETLTDDESEQYINLLENNMDTLHGYPNRWRLTHASWQQRTIALAAIKDIEIV